MKRDIAEKWIAELRSGKWKQGRTVLCGYGAEYCCLGVLCEMAFKENVCEKTGVTDVRYDHTSVILPKSVLDWGGLRDAWGRYGENATTDCLTYANDTGKTFLEIADIIEANIENL